MLRELASRIYVGALSAYIAIDIWLFHKGNGLADYLKRRGL